MSEKESTKPKIPRTVWVLGFVSLLMDISSEMIHAILPLFMAQSLGATAFWIGLTEGGAEAIALLGKVFSGAIADRFRKHKLLIFLGYGLGVASKPFFAIANSVAAVVFARFADRIGKGLRGAPRDALIADITPKESLGAAYGLRQSLDAAGAFIGPLIAAGLLFFLVLDMRAVFWMAFIPGLLCLALILFGVEGKESSEAPLKCRFDKEKFLSLLRLKNPAWRFVVLLGVLFSLARFSNAFIVLCASEAGIANALIPLVMVAMNFVFSAASFPFGKLADRLNPEKLLCVSLALLTLSDLSFALLGNLAGIALGVFFWGLHLASSQGVFSLIVARAAPEDYRASAFGVFNFFSGIALLFAGIFAGLFWDALGPAGTFLFGGFIALATLTLTLIHEKKSKRDFVKESA